MFWVPKEPSDRDGSFEYPQHIFWLKNKKKKSGTHSYVKAGMQYSLQTITTLLALELLDPFLST